MSNVTKPTIGLLGLMQELYDDMIPGITKHQEEYARKVVEKLSPSVELIFTRAARNRNDIEAILKDFNNQELDGVMIFNLTYGKVEYHDSI
jgi:L-arabinose isomerase